MLLPINDKKKHHSLYLTSPFIQFLSVSVCLCVEYQKPHPKRVSYILVYDVRETVLLFSAVGDNIYKIGRFSIRAYQV